MLIGVAALGACSHPQNPERRDPLAEEVTGPLRPTDPAFLKDDPAHKIACHADAACPSGTLCNPSNHVCFTSYPSPQVMKFEVSCPLVPVYFAEGSTELVPEAREWIEFDARCLSALGATALTLDGFADARGSKESNLDLSRRRAEVVKDALEQQGVPINIAVRGEGETQFGGNNEHDYAYDRRVELKANR
jgi:outer membrane protein OmpA-like peptidoglycan-associated protein